MKNLNIYTLEFLQFVQSVVVNMKTKKVFYAMTVMIITLIITHVQNVVVMYITMMYMK